MIPVLFELGPLKIHSFGVMLGLAFITAHFLFTREMRRRGMSEEVAGTITLIALVGGVVGAKLFSLLENWEQVTRDPVGEIFSGSGLTFYGGLIVVTLAIWYYVRKKKLSFLRVADAASPSLILAYGIGRIGCQLAGDGDYGIPSDLPWAMTYPNGTVPTLAESNPLLKSVYMKMYGVGPEEVPVDIAVHPTPIYETLAAVLIFLLLWSLRKRPMAAGMLFSIYLILAGLERFLVEFIRLNPDYLTLSQAQWISLGMIGLGGLMWSSLRNKPADPVLPYSKPASGSAGKNKGRRRA